jgi:hypothetical protein
MRTRNLPMLAAALALVCACGGAVQVQSLRLDGLPASSTAGGQQTLYVTALDTNGNQVESYTGTVHFTSTSPSVVVPADYAFQTADLGQHPFQVTFEALGALSLTVTDTLTPSLSASGATTTVAPKLTGMSVDIPQAVSGGQSFDATVTVTDEWGGPATLYTGTVHFTSSDPQAVLPADYTFTAADQGVHTFAGGVTLSSGGSQSVTVADAADSLTARSLSTTVQ